jgi:hypothetical protein
MSTTGGYGYGGGTSYTYGGTGGGTTTYYTPYTPKGGPSRVWFHLLCAQTHRPSLAVPPFPAAARFQPD